MQYVFFFILSSICLSYNTSRTVWCAVANVARRDARSWVTCVNNSSAANADCHMVNVTVSRIENQVAGSCIRYVNLFADTGLLARSSRKVDAEFAEYGLCKSRAVGTMSQTGTAVNVRISYKLQSVGSNRGTISASDNGAGRIGTITSTGTAAARI